MGWVAFIVIQAFFVVSGYRHAKSTNQWSWSLFLFALSFAGLESLILIVPVYSLGVNSLYFGWTYAICGVIAALNFIWFIMVCRRWRLPDGRTSLEAAREEKAALKAQENERVQLPDLDRK